MPLHWLGPLWLRLQKAPAADHRQALQPQRPATGSIGPARPRRRAASFQNLAKTRALSLLLSLGLASPGLALSLSLPPGSEITGSDTLPSGVQLPIGPSREGEIPRADFPGQVQREAYFIPGVEGTLALTAPLRDQLGAAGWQVLVDCASAACGGFDFRFALSVLPEPAMHVDLGDFRYLAAQKEDELIAILASKRGSAGYLQITHASRPEAAPSEPAVPLSPDERPGTADVPPSAPVIVTPGPAPDAAEISPYQPGQLADTLERLGRITLQDLDFATGSTTLGPGPFPSLTELAAYLSAHPARKVALVGHTDATGGLEVNITVSRRRAQSVLDHLVKNHGIPRAQLSAEGVGFLSPIQSNLTDKGRGANRRVEAVLLSVE